MTNTDRQELIEQATELVATAQNLVDEAVSGTPIENNYLAYGRYGFDQLLGNGNPYDDGLHSLQGFGYANDEESEEGGSDE